MNIDAVFKRSCLNCGRDISAERLIRIGVCYDCLKRYPQDLLNKDLFERVEATFSLLKKEKTLKNFKSYYERIKDLKDFEKFFEKILGNRPWSAQRTWAIRALNGESFTIIAPTGVGKTVFGIILSLYLVSRRNKKVYFILPTISLVDQVYEKMSNFRDKIDVAIRILKYSSSLSSKKRKEVKELIRKGEFDILITTSQFLTKGYETLLYDKKFDLIFVDDVDAVLKSSKNIDKIFFLLGFDESDIRLGMELINLKSRLLSVKDKNKLESIRSKIEELERILEYKIKKKEIGQILVSSATGRARGRRVKLFRELLKFDIGGIGEGLRNIVDCYEIGKNYEKLLNLVKKLGKGGLIFVSKDLGIEEAKKIEKYLREHGIKAELLIGEERNKEDIIDGFESGEFDILIGISHYYGVLTRGLDLPEIIRYAIFYEVPNFKINVTKGLTNVFFILSILSILAKYFDDRELKQMLKISRAYMRNLSPSAILIVNNFLSGIETEKSVSKYIMEFLEFIKKVRDKILEYVEDEKKFSKLEEYPYAKFYKENGDVYVLIPDVATYIQASGRTSRLYAGGITKGLSIILSDHQQLINGLERKMRWRFFGFSLKKIDEVDIESVLKEIDEDRERVRMFKKGIFKEKVEDPIKTVLFIVESPNKARTIANFFGKPTRRRYDNLIVYEITTGKYLLNIVATVGHIVDLIEDEGYYGVIVDKKHNVYIPIYGTIKTSDKYGQFVSLRRYPDLKEGEYKDKKDIIDALRKLAEEADLILIATDPDTEGEKIAWDVYTLLRYLSKDIKRAEFHEVTLPAILNAINNPREIDFNMVKAQIVRRIEDRWIGFVLSRKVQEKFKKPWLSAGRVQTPVLGWVINNFDERQEDLHYYFRVETDKGISFVFDEPSLKKQDTKSLKDFINRIKGSKIEIVKLEIKEEEITPLPPYDTEKMIADASLYLGFSAAKTMALAQDLFEAGLITYHRTDSTRVSSAGIEVAKQYINTELRDPSLFVPRHWGEGGAHECIRPTRPVDRDDLEEMIELGFIQGNITEDHLDLYDLIFRRFIASQMRKAKVKKVKYTLKILDKEVEIEGIGEIIDKGFFIMYKPVFFTELPIIHDKFIVPTEITYWLDSKIELYTQGSLISEMRKKGIGRPSTYATIVSKLLERGYVIESKRKYLIPTKLGREVYSYLESNYREFVCEERTRLLEEKMDRIAEGKEDYIKILDELYEEIQRIEKVAV